MILHLYYWKTCSHFVMPFYQKCNIRMYKSVHQGCLFLSQYARKINATYINQQLENTVFKWKG